MRVPDLQPCEECAHLPVMEPELHDLDVDSLMHLWNEVQDQRALLRTLTSENISVEQMLGRRRQREEREQEQERVRREQEQSRWLHNSSARTLSWEERQEQVMLRRRQHRQEEAYRRLAATREARKLVKGAGLDGDLSPTMGALLRDMPSKLKEEEERDGV